MRISRREVISGITLAALSDSLWAQVPSVPSCLDKLAAERIDIDVHCHIFNGSDLQVEQFIDRVKLEQVNGYLRTVLEKLAKILQRAVWKRAPRGEDELGRLERFGHGPSLRSLSLEKFSAYAEEDAREADWGYAKSFSEELRTPEGREFLNAYGAYLESIAATNPQAAAALSSKEYTTELERLAEPEGLLKQLEMEGRLANWSVSSVFRFINCFFQYRYVNAFRMLRNYGCEHGSVQIIAPALVDYDYALGAGKSPTPTTLPVQFKVASRISEVFAGRVMHYLPFDPWRWVLEGPATFELEKEYVSSGAAAGFKLYPPMGFAPLGNERLLRAPKSWPSVPDFGKKLDDAMNALWKFTTENDVPVLTHAGMSNAAAPDFLGLGSPGNWKNVFDAYPNARVCFGHSGGEELLDAENEWPLGFANLMKAYPNAFGDISYFENVLSLFRERGLRRRLASYLGSNSSMSEKIIYGSDWTMLAIEAKADRYFEKFATLLSDKTKFSPSVKDNVLSNNAIRFLGLRTNQRSRQRLQSFYAKNNVDVAWLRAIT